MAWNWKKTILVVVDIVVGAYLVLAMTAFNKPDERANVCTEVPITIEQEIVDGFLTVDKIQQMLQQKHLYPMSEPMEKVDTRLIEETLQSNELIDHAECYKTQTGRVCITVKQRIPVIRIMAANGDNYYVDSQGKTMPHMGDYTCNTLVATGHISKSYACRMLAPLATTVVADKFWKNQIVQLNVLSDGSVELVPRVGEHIAYLGQPVNIGQKLNRLRKFYRYGLSQAGWNQYSRVSVEFDNQIICKRKRQSRRPI